MTESPVEFINIEREIPFYGSGDTLFERLKNVRLKGFPDVRIYQHSNFQLRNLTPEEIQSELHTPQTCVYKNPNLSRIEKLVNLFAEKGIDIMHLHAAYDYTANHESGEISEWTMLPPIVERFNIPTIKDRLSYKHIIGPTLQEHLNQENLSLNQEALLPQTSNSQIYNLINDGSHRIHHAFKKSGITILIAEGMTPGYPYYAAPQKYNVTVFESRDEALKHPETKIHIVESPGHKALYRLFPSGGIKSGDVRPH